MAEAGPSTLEDVLRWSKAQLREAGLDDPALESRILVEHFTGTTRAHSITAPKRPVEPGVAAQIMAAVRRRLGGEPVHRIIGWRGFYGLDLIVSPDTLEPRQDTEALVEEMLGTVRDVSARKGVCRILDLGTGTGAIALALLSQEKAAIAVGVDISSQALVTARQNADRLGIGARFTALQSNWYYEVVGRFDVIVSNPPYIPTGLISSLDPEVRDFDPIAALDGGEDGFDAYRLVAAKAREHLEDDGRIGVEIGFDQRLDVEMIFAKAQHRLISERRDLGGRDRVLVFAR